MKIKPLTIITLFALAATTCSESKVKTTANYSTDWQNDVLGDSYRMRYVNQHDDYDGAVKSTIIRKEALCDSSSRAVLYVHGFNDYFFQKEMGDRFSDSCYNFYAVDLRKYGRSIIDGQKKFEARNLNEYFADIDSALHQIVADGNKEITLIGHSTGGLITSYYLDCGQGRDYPINGLILNSPFLDWNLSKFQESILVPLVSKLKPILKKIKISQGGGTDYSQSLLKKHHGEWDYNTNWKLEKSPDVSIGWISAIQNAQHKLQSKDVNIDKPVLLLHSDKSVGGNSRTEEYNNGDAVLDVNDISKYGKHLSKAGVTEITEKGGLHDLVLSRPEVRNKVYDDIFHWLDTLNNKKTGAYLLKAPAQNTMFQ